MTAVWREPPLCQGFHQESLLRTVSVAAGLLSTKVRSVDACFRLSMWLYHLKAIAGQCCSSFQATLQSIASLTASNQDQDPEQRKLSASHLLSAPSTIWPELQLVLVCQILHVQRMEREKKKFLFSFLYLCWIYSKVIWYHSCQKKLSNYVLSVMRVGSLILPGNEKV